MDNVTKIRLKKIMSSKLPDSSQVKPPTAHAVVIMTRNLRAKANQNQ